MPNDTNVKTIFCVKQCLCHNIVSLLLSKGAKNDHEKNFMFISFLGLLKWLVFREYMKNEKNKLWILYKSTFTFHLH